MVFLLILFGIIFLLLFFLFILIFKIISLKQEIISLKFLKRSQSVKYGQLTEQWIPFSKDFPFNPQNFCFIGKPIDGVCFNEDKIIFLEFKTNKASLSDSQKKIKKLVLDKKIEWFELKID